MSEDNCIHAASFHSPNSRFSPEAAEALKAHIDPSSPSKEDAVIDPFCFFLPVPMSSKIRHVNNNNVLHFLITEQIPWPHLYILKHLGPFRGSRSYKHSGVLNVPLFSSMIFKVSEVINVPTKAILPPPLSFSIVIEKECEEVKVGSHGEVGFPLCLRGRGAFY